MKMDHWTVTHKVAGTVVEVDAATPEAAARKAFGTMLGHHWESFVKPEDVPTWGHCCATVTGARGTFYCALIEHG